MPTFEATGISIHFEQQGARTDPPLLLLHGIGCQLVQWPQQFIDGLTARGLRVIYPDNRDVGLSGKLSAHGRMDLAQVMTAMGTGTPVDAPYSLADMAEDARALLDHLGLMDAHVLGVSMGGMIAQHLAIAHPERVRSLISVMSSSGDPELPAATPEAAAALVAAPAGTDRASLIAHQENVWNLIGGPRYHSSEEGIGKLAARAIDRMVYPEGFARQLAAIVADGSRVTRLGGITAPTLVIHGDQDPLVPLAAGESTASAIPGATLEVVSGMGHDLPETLIPLLVEIIERFTERVERETAPTPDAAQGGPA